MNNTTVECPHCHSKLEAPMSLHGSEVDCPACKRSFVIDIKQNVSMSEKKNTAKPTASLWQTVVNLLCKPQNIFAGISLLALLTSIATLIIVFFSSGGPQVKVSSDPAEAIKNHLSFRVELDSVLGSYFWKKNGAKILKSLDIKEIKTNGNWAVAFYKLSLGATEVKEAMFLYKSADGYWIRVSPYIAEKRCQTNWYNDMKKRVDRFTKDSGEFDILDF